MGIVSSAFGYDNPNFPKITKTAPTSLTFNNNTGSVNSTNFWDNLNTPSDINIFCLLTGCTITGDLNVNDKFFVNSTNGYVSIGYDQTIPDTGLFISEGAVLINGFVGGTPVSGAGARMMWIPEKAAFRGGEVSGDQWDDANIGQNSFASGYDAEASGMGSFSAGAFTTASDYGTFAVGFFNTASAQGASALGGLFCNAESYGSSALGRYNVGGGNKTHWIETDPLLEVGNGNSTVRHNALTIYKNGDAELNGDLTVEGNVSYNLNKNPNNDDLYAGWCGDNYVIGNFTRLKNAGYC